MAIPRDAQFFPSQMDPGDVMDFALDWEIALKGADGQDGDEGEILDTDNWQVIVPAESALIGLVVMDELRAPQIGEDGLTMKFWFSVAEGEQDDPRFDANGAVAMVKNVVQTKVPGDPEFLWRRFERTALLRIVNM